MPVSMDAGAAIVSLQGFSVFDDALQFGDRPEIDREREIVFVDGAIDDIDTLLAGVEATEVFVLDPNVDGIEQISAVLAARQQISGLHLISHGQAGGLELGSTQLNADTLTHYEDELRKWSNSLASNADVLLYGCHVAAGADGTEFVRQFGQLTSADIAASSDRTGSADLAGDWVFELAIGDIDTDVAVSQSVRLNYRSVLDTTFEFADFSDVGDLTLNGAAERDGNRLALTPDWFVQAGSAYFATPIEIDGDTSFQTQFQFQLEGGSGGADGFTFVLQNSGDGADAIGDVGGSVGYDGIDRSLAVEFDTYENFFDPNDNHIDLLRDGDVTAALATADAGLPNFNSSDILNAWIDYDGSSDRLEVFVSENATRPDTPAMSQTVELDAIVGSQAYVGFTAGTGWRTNEHGIANWSFNAETVSDGSTFALADSETIFVTEGAGVATITAVRTGDLQSPATLEYTTNEVGGTGVAEADIDYTTPVFDGRANTGQIAFNSGEAEKTFDIPIVDDTSVEGNETFAVGIQNASTGTLGAPRTVLIEIVDDDDLSLFAVSETDITVSEGDANASVTVQRSGNIDSLATVDFTTADGTAIAGEDYAETAGTITFAAGETTQTTNIPILKDGNSEAIETFSVALSNPTGATLDSQITTTISILDNDSALGSLSRQTVFSGLDKPTTLDWTPDGRFMLIAQKNGIVRIVDNGNLQSTPTIDLSSQVNDASDRGLLGLAIHPDFPTTPYLYLLHTYDPPETEGQTGAAGPDGRGNRPSRLVRVEVDPTTAIADPASLTVLAGTNSIWDYTSQPGSDSTGDRDIVPSGIVNGTTITAPADQIELGVQDNDPDRPGIQNENIRDYLATDSTSHSIGDIHFGPDGLLYFSNGDGTSYNFGDPRTVRVQDINNLSGKVLRIDPITGQGVAGNPFFDGDASSNQSKVFYSGMRNPFRFTFDPVTGLPVIGDVGWNTWEEINTGAPGSNFGWPYIEGPDRPGIYRDLEQAIAFYNNGNVNPGSPSNQPAVSAKLDRKHGAPDFANAIFVGDFYDDNTLVFGDVNGGTIYAATLDGDRDVSNVQVLDDDVPFVVDMRKGPDGNLYGVRLGGGEILRWEPA